MPRIPALFLAAVAVLLSGCGGSSAGRVATVNGHDISQSALTTEYHYDCATTADQFGTNICQDKNSSYVRSQMKKESLQALIDRELIQQYASSHGITVSAGAFQRNWANIYRSKFNSQPVLKAFVKRYGITVRDLKARIRSDMLRTRVAYAVSRSRPARVPAIRLASLRTVSTAENLLVKTRLKNGESFVQVAAQLAKNPVGACKSTCGDLGWIPTALLPAYEQSLATAPVGKVQGPIRLQAGGYQMFLVEARDSRYPLTQKQQVTMQNQVYFPQWLAAQEKKASIKRYLKA